MPGKKKKPSLAATALFILLIGIGTGLVVAGIAFLAAWLLHTY